MSYEKSVNNLFSHFSSPNVIEFSGGLVTRGEYFFVSPPAQKPLTILPGTGNLPT